MDQRAVDFEILEKENDCGGLMRTLKEDGFIFDCSGSHIIFSKDKEVLDFILNVLGDNKVLDRRNSKILYKGCYVKYPFENNLSILPKEENFECLHYFFQNLLDKEQGKVNTPNNLKEWCYYTFGKGIAEKYLIPYNEKIWKFPSEKTNLKWVERIPNPPVEDIIKSSIGIETEGYLHQLNFYYPIIDGIQAIIKNTEQKIRSHISSGFNVKKVVKEDNQWIVSDGRNEKKYDTLVSTIPIQHLMKAMDIPAEVKEAVKGLKYNSLITVMLGLASPKVNNLTWLYIPEKESLSHRVSFPSNYGPFVAPKGKSSVLAEITCTLESDVWRLKDEAIIHRVIDDLHSSKIIDKHSICFTKVIRSEYAYVINDLAYEKNIQVVRDYSDKMGIALLGRFAEFEYLNMDACIRHCIDYVNKHYVTPLFVDCVDYVSA